MVIGGGAAGMSAAAQARRVAPDLEIVVLEQSAEVSVGLCGLPYFVGGTVSDPRSLVVHSPEYFRRERRMDVRTLHRVESLAAGARTLTGRNLQTGEPFELRYDHLVLATGARAARLGVDGERQPHVFFLRTLEDGVRLRAFLEQRTARRAVVLGGGFIGLELAEALHRWRISVTVVDAAARLAAGFDPSVSELVTRELDAHGIGTRLGERVLGLGPDAVVTTGGSIPADLVVVAVGNQANLDLVKSGGAEVGRTGALTVSRRMQTSLPAVWAAGDCAESRSAVSGRPIHLPLGSVANLHGRAAGSAAAGRAVESVSLAGTQLLEVFDLALARTGLNEEQAVRAGFAPVAAEVGGPVRAPIFGDVPSFSVRLLADARSGRLLGGQIAGHRDAARRIDAIAALLISGAGLREAAGQDFGYTPPLGTARDPVGQAAQRLLEVLTRR
ncbi:MAG: FAD-dependent oxidoreductase [Symbiobacteriia bacterium]